MPLPARNNRRKYLVNRELLELMVMEGEKVEAVLEVWLVGVQVSAGLLLGVEAAR